MIDLVRPKLTIPEDSRIKINEHRNPYLSKLTIKVLPNSSDITGPTLFSPLKTHGNVIINQSLPLWRNQKFRIDLIWQQNLRKSFNRTHIGFLTQYKSAKNYALKSRNLIGSSFMTTNEASKAFNWKDKKIIASIYHSCFFQSIQDNYHSIGGGICLWNNLTLAICKRIHADTSFKVHYERPIPKNLFLRINYDAQIDRLDQSTVEVGIGYHFSESSSCWLRTAIQSIKVEPNLAVEFQYTKQGKSVVSSLEYRNNKSILYLGYKCPSFNFILPVFGTDSVIPALIGIGLFFIGYFNKKISQNSKKKIVREKNHFEQLKLVSDKANQIYKKEEHLKGLLIQQVYVGPKNLLMKFLEEPNKHVKILRDDEFKDKIYDCTVGFRFYVQKGQLSIPKGNKLNMIGVFYRTQEDDDTHIYINYTKRDIKQTIIIHENDEIIL